MHRHLLLSLLAAFATACASTPDAEPHLPDVDAATPDATPAPATIRVLPLGDSLTLGYGSAQDGAGSEGGYRARLAERLAAEGIAVDFVGSQTNGPPDFDDREHEGHNGYAVAQLAELADAALAAYDPHLILLMAGTNDQIELVPPSQPPAGAAADLEALIEQIHARSPDVQIVLAQLIPLTLNDLGVTEYNALLPAIVERQRERGVDLQLVDMYAIGEEHLSSDGIHPTVAGYDAMADIWLPAALEAIGRRGDVARVR